MNAKRQIKLNRRNLNKKKKQLTLHKTARLKHKMRKTIK